MHKGIYDKRPSLWYFFLLHAMPLIEGCEKTAGVCVSLFPSLPYDNQATKGLKNVELKSSRVKQYPAAISIWFVPKSVRAVLRTERGEVVNASPIVKEMFQPKLAACVTQGTRLVFFIRHTHARKIHATARNPERDPQQATHEGY